MEELDFLIDNEKNILEAEICDVQYADGKNEVCLSLVVSMETESQMAKIMSELKDGDPQPDFRAVEIIIGERDLKKVLKQIKEFKIN